MGAQEGVEGVIIVRNTIKIRRKGLRLISSSTPEYVRDCVFPYNRGQNAVSANLGSPIGGSYCHFTASI